MMSVFPFIPQIDPQEIFQLLSFLLSQVAFPPFSQLVLWFTIYSVLGWLYETTFCSLRRHHLERRGFLSGPYCPIYGFAAISDVVLLGWISNPIALFAAGALISAVLEYFTGWVFETVFQRRYWDYTNRPFNVKGRICPLGMLVFGTAGLLLIFFVHPVVTGMLGRISPDMQDLLAFCALMMFAIDTFASTVRTRPELTSVPLRMRLSAALPGAMGSISPSDIPDMISERFRTAADGARSRGRDAKNRGRDAANAFRASGAQRVEDAKRKVIELIADIKDKAA